MKVEAASTWPLIFLHHDYAYRELSYLFFPLFLFFFFFLFSLSSCIHLLRAISNESNEAHVLSSLFLSSLFPFFQRSVSGLLFGGPFNRDLERWGEYGKNPGEVRMKERGGRPS